MMERQDWAENLCVNLIIDILKSAGTDFNFDVSASSIYLVPHSPHLHREMWTKIDVFVVLTDVEDWFDSSVGYSNGLRGEVNILGVTTSDHFNALKQQIAANLRMDVKFVESIITNIEIITIPTEAIVSAIKMKAFW